MNPNRSLAVWGAVSALVAVTSATLYFWTRQGATFFLMLNLANLALLAAVWSVRARLRRGVERLMALAAGSPRLEIHYPGEARVGGTLLGIAVAFSLFMIVVAFVDVGRYSELIREDGFVEYASSAAWFLAALVMLLQLVRQDTCELNRRYRWLNLAGLTAFFILCGGEEISWGQRILGLHTPRVLDEINVQHEITLHNVGSISVFENLFFLIAVMFFLVVPYGSSRSGFFRRLLEFVRFPVANRFAVYVFLVSLAAWVVIGVRFGTLGFHPFSIYPEHYYTQMDDEFFELMAAFSFLVFSLLDANKQVAVAPGGTGSGVS